METERQITVFYEGWGERFPWAVLGAYDVGGAPRFEYTAQALSRGLELSPYLLPLRKPSDAPPAQFPHQMGLPGPVYDALPDGWGLLLMDRQLKAESKAALPAIALTRLRRLGGNTLGALTFDAPEQGTEAEGLARNSPLRQVALDIQQVLANKGDALLGYLARVGGAPHGARPKALANLHEGTGEVSWAARPGARPWIFKFPLANEHPEVSFVEDLYATAARACELDMPETVAMSLGEGLSAFGARRFDREDGLRVPVHTLAAFTGANYRVPGSLSYSTWLQVTKLFTNDMQEVRKAFERAVFNVIFNNRDDHGKNFSYRMEQEGLWKLSPLYDVTYNPGTGGYHHMDVSGEALCIRKKHLQALGAQAELSPTETNAVIERMAAVASGWPKFAKAYDGQVRKQTLRHIGKVLATNIKAARS